jgi:hypothetical protein
VTTADAVGALQSGNQDIVVVRVSGSVKMVYLPDEIQGKLSRTDHTELIAGFLLEAAEKVQGV